MNSKEIVEFLLHRANVWEAGVMFVRNAQIANELRQCADYIERRSMLEGNTPVASVLRRVTRYLGTMEDRVSRAMGKKSLED